MERQPVDPVPSAPRQPPPARRKRRPYVTIALVLANIGAFILQDGDITGFAQDPFAVWSGEYWRIATGTFLHGFFAHLFLNMMMLFVVGEILERFFGHRVLMLTYTVCGLAGGFAFQAFSTGGVGLGASGAVYGLFGVFFSIRFGYFVDGVFRLRRMFFVMGAIVPVADWLFARYAAPEMFDGAQVATSAHLGGYLCGLLMGYVITAWPFYQLQRRRRILTCVLVGGLTALGVYACFFPYYNSAWHEWSEVRQLQLVHEEGGEALQAAIAKVKDKGRRAQIVARQLAGYVRAAQRSTMLTERSRAAGDLEGAELHRQETLTQYRRAVQLWRLLPLELKIFHDLQMLAYMVFDDLMGRGDADAIAREQLDELIETAQRSIDYFNLAVEEAQPAEALPRELRSVTDDWRREFGFDESWSAERAAYVLYNQFAWYLTLKGDGERLQEALSYALRAVSKSMADDPSFWQRLWSRDNSDDVSSCINTLGWVQFLLSENPEAAAGLEDNVAKGLREDAIKHLQQAAELSPIGPNFLYLAYAYWKQGEVELAIQNLELAEEAGLPLRYERRVLGELKDELSF